MAAGEWRRLVPVLLSIWATCAWAQNSGAAYMVDGASAVSLAPTLNYAVGPDIPYLYTQGSGNTFPIVAYIHFDFSAFAPVASKFCATGTPTLFLRGIDGNSTHIRAGGTYVDVPSTNWIHFMLTWNTQPNPSTSLKLVQTTLGGGEDRWWSAPLTGELISVSVIQNASLRIRFMQATEVVTTTWETHFLNATNSPHVTFDYYTCDAHATCNRPQGLCACNEGYVGDGVTCAERNCTATTMGNADFPDTISGTNATGVCHVTYGGSPTSVCTKSVWGAVSDPCVKLTCPADNSGNYGFATFSIADAGTTATGQCLEGYNSTAPTRQCDNNGVWSLNVTDACVRVWCPPDDLGHADFPPTMSLTTATGTCQTGYSGAPTSFCTAQGTWESVENPCTRIQCSGFYDAANNITWPTTLSLEYAEGACSAGHEGLPQRLCRADGTWDAVIGSCSQLTCPASLNYTDADWAPEFSNTTAVGVCVSGYSGAPQRLCQLDATWSPEVTSPCTRNLCAFSAYENAAWPADTLSNTVVVGTCNAGYSGTPSRKCLADGTWDAFVLNPCHQNTCSAGVLDNADWPSAIGGTSGVSGTCSTGFTGPTTRDCNLNGTWSAVTTPCTRNVCAAKTESNAQWPQTNSLVSASGVCVAGWAGSPTRYCSAAGVFESIVGSCVQKMCPPLTSNKATWTSVTAGTANVVGECELGYSGAPKRSCSIDGAWGSQSGTSCTRIKCAAVNESDAQALWPQTDSGTFSLVGSCYFNSVGTPKRNCLYDGTWSAVVGACITNPCPALSNNEHASWPSPAAVDTVVEGVCVAGYNTTVSPSRLCRRDGTWDSAITNPCEPLYCTHESPSFTAHNASWPIAVQAGSTVNGLCMPGFWGTTTRSCSLAAVWSVPSPVCFPLMCIAIPSDGRQSWSPVEAGQVAVGTCVSGYVINSSGESPTRRCDISGNWDPVVTNDCVLRVEARIDSVEVTAKTATSITLEWEMSHATSTSVVRVDIAVGTGAYQIANGGSALGIKSNVYTVSGLAENTLYLIRVTPGSGDQYETVYSQVVSVKTSVLPPTGIGAMESTSTSVSFAWSASPLATFYDIYYRIAPPARADMSEYTFHGRVAGSTTQATIGNLAAGRSYEVVVFAGQSGEVESVGTRLTVATSAAAPAAVEDVNSTGSVVGGVAAGVTILIIIIVVAVVLVRRRKSNSSDKNDAMVGMEIANFSRQQNYMRASSFDTLQANGSSMSLGASPSASTTGSVGAMPAAQSPGAYNQMAYSGNASAPANAAWQSDVASLPIPTDEEMAAFEKFMGART